MHFKEGVVFVRGGGSNSLEATRGSKEDTN